MQGNYEYLTAFRNRDNLHGHLSQKNQQNRIKFCFAFVQFLQYANKTDLMHATSVTR